MLLWFNPRRENNNQNTKQPIRRLHSLSWRWTCSCLQVQLSGPQQTNHRPTSRKKINAKTQLSLKRQQKGGRSIEPLSCSRWGVFFLLICTGAIIFLRLLRRWDGNRQSQVDIFHWPKCNWQDKVDIFQSVKNQMLG